MSRDVLIGLAVSGPLEDLTFALAERWGGSDLLVWGQ